MSKPQQDSRAIYARLIHYIGKHKTLFFTAVFFMVLLALVQVGLAAILKPIVNEGLVEQTARAAVWLPIQIFVLMTMRSIVGFLSNYSMAKVGRLVIKDLRTDVFAQLIRLPSHFYDKNSSSKLVSKLIYDVEQTAIATTDTLTSLVRDSLTAIGLVAWMLYLNWQLTLIGFACVPLVFAVTSYANRRFRKTSKDIQDSMGDIANNIKEAALGQKVIKIYGGQKQETARFKQTNSDNFQKNLKRATVSAAVVPVTMLCIAPTFALVLYIYLNYLGEGKDAAGEFVSFLGAFMMLMSPLKQLAKVNEKIQIGVTAAKSVFQIVDAEAEQDSGHIPLQHCTGHLDFAGVGFQYLPKTTPVIDGIDFSIKAGQRVALVGASGSGKSTIATLLMRFYRADTGSIKLDGVDINDYVLSDYRNMISLVSQETVLFDDTVRNNIVYGCVDTDDDERLQTAMKAAHVDEFINKLPEGLSTMVGEHGLRLSGGQRQRIAIARAIYKNAPIIIMDEATSALDTKSERFVQDAMETLLADRTSIIIAHRLTTIESADQILVVHQGKLVEQGTHKELLDAQGFYAELHHLQKTQTVNAAE
ncbi:MAG: lipid A export permease/ATP-binding protein MsbA [Arenicella sp.]